VRRTIVSIAAIVFLAPLFAQETGKTATTVPRLVRLTGVFHPANGLPVGTTESATLSVYREQQGGTPLWQETQNVSVDANGQYTAMLGATQNDGVPLDLFSSTEPRWVGVQFNRPGEAEQARVQLVSVPYAIATPEPGFYGVLAIGLAGLFLALKYRRNKQTA
jgi:trimeric autotransporter adhesin